MRSAHLCFLFPAFAAWLCGCPEHAAPLGSAQATDDGLRDLEPAGAVLPVAQMACGALSDRARPVPSLAQTRQALAHAASHAPLALALRRAGMSDEAAAQLVWAAAAHNAGQGLDPVHARAQQIHAAQRAAVRRFNAELEAQERRTGRAIDREALNQRLGLPLAVEEVLR
jgi:hypothetical protein